MCDIPQMDDKWLCAVCSIPVYDDAQGEPSSKYWNVARSEVYCGADHSLNRDNEVKQLL